MTAFLSIGFLIVPAQVQPKADAASLHVSLDNYHPISRHSITMHVYGLPKSSIYHATYHYRTKNTYYSGHVGTYRRVRTGTDTKGYKVRINVSAKYHGHTYHASTSFTPKKR